ncbi:hypothetical protein ODD08_004744 [Salmonella enterica]|nr:hypothetical protein [Salmonella enterica]
MLKKSLLIASLLFSTYTVAHMDNTKYSAYFKTQSGICLLQVNDVSYISTLHGPRTISTGMDISDGLENGNNDIGIAFYPSLSKIQYDEKSCEIKITKRIEGQSEETVTSFKIVFNEKHNHSYEDKSAYSVIDITDTTGNKLTRGIYNKITLRGDPGPEDWITATRRINVTNIPEWQWTKATPQIENAALRSQLVSSYQELINDLNSNDIAKVKEKYSIALEEYTNSNPQQTKDIYFSSIGIEDAMKEGKLSLHPDWSKYNIYFYQHNKIFCLAMDEGNRNSPIRFYDNNGDFVFAWNPFFSMINGKLVLVR